jgi:hypothetical protein
MRELLAHTYRLILVRRSGAALGTASRNQPVDQGSDLHMVVLGTTEWSDWWTTAAHNYSAQSVDMCSAA